MNNIINKQTFELHINDTMRREEIEHTFSTLNHNKILSQFDSVFSNFATANEILYIDRLVLDLGYFSYDNLDDEFVEKLKEYLELELKKYCEQAGLSRLQVKSPSHIQSPVPLILKADAFFSSNQESPVYLTESNYLILLITYFFFNGVLPWWCNENMKNLNINNIVETLIDDEPAAMKILLHQIIHSINTQKRLIYQCDYSCLCKVFTMLCGIDLKKFMFWLEELQELFLLLRLKQIDITFIWESLFHFYQYQSKEKIAMNTISYYILINFIVHKTDDCLFFIKQLYMQSLQLKQERILKSELLDIINNLYQKSKHYDNNLQFTEHLSKEHNYLLDKTEQQQHDKSNPLLIEQTDPNSIKGKRERIIQKNTDFHNESSDLKNRLTGSKKELDNDHIHKIIMSETSHEKEFYIENSGLIILATFLKSFFSRITVIKDNKFISKNARLKAIYILEYLVGGNEEPAEYVVTLNKILVGWPLEKPVPRNILLTDFEKKESLDFLKSVISKWSVLKNTSVPGFRTSFLQRKGIITDQENNWLLKVEHKSYDVLLEKLPWTISMIKLAWMNKLMVTQW